eukprot:187906_1
MGTCCQQHPTQIAIQIQPIHANLKFKSDEKSESKSDFETERLIQYKVGRTLGAGAWSDVVEAHDKANINEKVAIKIMQRNKKNKQLFEREIAIFKQLTPIDKPSHPNIVPFIGEGEDKRCLFIVTALMTGGELFDHIVSGEITNRSYPLMLRMLEAVKYCHDRNIVHRDLKPENFMYADKGAASEIVLIDFGISSHVQDNEVIRGAPLEGTPDYMAPELAINVLNFYRRNRYHIDVSEKIPPKILLTGKILKASDVWAMGVIAYVIMTGSFPFAGHTVEDIFHSIVLEELKFGGMDGNYKNVLNLGEHFKDFVRKALTKDPEKRLTMEEALRHPWVKGVTADDFRLNKEVLPWLRQFHYQTRLKREVERILAAEMSGEPEKKVLSHFERLDEDGDGLLSLEELTHLFLHMGYADCVAKDEAQQMIEKADANGDGKMDLNDFKKVYCRKMLSEDDRYIHRVFALFDRNGDGFIDKNDLKMIMPPDSQITSPSIQQMFDEVDENNGGMIDFNAFKKAMKEDIKAVKQFTLRGSPLSP